VSEVAVRARLLSFDGLTALVGERVWFSGMPQDPTLPAVTVQQISGVPESVMGVDTGRVRGRVQVDAWAPTRAAAEAVGEEVRVALQRWVGDSAGRHLVFTAMNSAGVRYESEGRIWRARQDFELWWTETYP
jgi:hypothetical protein